LSNVSALCEDLVDDEKENSDIDDLAYRRSSTTYKRKEDKTKKSL
jgi:hypothetical protein